MTSTRLERIRATLWWLNKFIGGIVMGKYNVNKENMTLTANGANTHVTTHNECLDFFALGGALKDNARAKARARPNAFLMFARIFIIC